MQPEKNRDYCLLRGDARILADKVGPHDLAVFSPPYPNSFDYTDVYNVELWVLGYLNGRQANTRLRRSTLTSHVQVRRNSDNREVKSITLKATVEALSNVRSKLWNQHIPEMIDAYGNDMAVILKKLATDMRPFGRIYMVVGDSRYADINIPVATILAEIATTLGYDVKELEPCRSMRTSPQQGGRQDLQETLIVLQRHR